MLLPLEMAAISTVIEIKIRSTIYNKIDTLEDSCLCPMIMYLFSLTNLLFPRVSVLPSRHLNS